MEHEKDYAAHDIELALIVHALKMWRHYLLGRIFELRMDHMILKYLFEQPNLNTMQAQWMEFMCEFDFDIKNVRGKENKVTDALRMRFHVVVISMCQTNRIAIILDALHYDKMYLQVQKELNKSHATRGTKVIG